MLGVGVCVPQRVHHFVVICSRSRHVDEHDHAALCHKPLLEDAGELALAEGDDVGLGVGVVAVPLEGLQAAAERHERHVDV